MMNGTPDDMSGAEGGPEPVPPPASPSVPPASPSLPLAGGERTVIASPDVVAAALAAQSAPPPPDPFGTGAAPLSVAPASAPPPPMFVASGPGSADALVGVQLNDLFEVVRFIAEGGMGRVYEGRNIASGEQVAIKVILGQYAADEQFMALFRREASALEKIGHDALVKYRALAFDRGKNINYLAIEYVNGPSLADALTGQPADPVLVKRVLRRLALGLEAAHEAGVIHRDLSPDNVLLPGGNIERAKIIDFGIAKDNNPGQKSVVGEAFAGKFGYAAPEVFGKFGRRIGAWTDIYSLGLVIAAFARGTPVEMGITIVDALEARETVPDISDLSPDLQAIVARMLAPDPAQRFQTMAEVADACDPRGSVMGTTTPPAAPAFVKAQATPEPAPPARKSGVPMPAIAAGVVAVLGIGGWFAFSSGSKPPASPAPAEAVAPATTAPAPDPVASAAAWATSAPLVGAALKTLPCADVRIDGEPQGGRVRLTGWRAQATMLPANIAGWPIDASAVAVVAAPAPETCRIIDSIRAAASSDPQSAFSMPGSQVQSLTTLPRGSGGTVLLDLKLTDRPGGRTLLASIDDRATSASQRVVSGDVDEAGIDPSAIPFEAKPARYLLVLVASRQKLFAATNNGADAGMAAACRDGGCKLASGWIEVR
jgi:serine/threonine-protein kinase